MARGCLFIAGLLLVTLLARPAQATVLALVDEGMLTRQAQSVVRGQVIAKAVVVLAGRPWTDTTIQVSEVLKGALRPGAKMIVRQPGGESAGLGMRVVGVASFKLGEEVLLFARYAAGRHQPVGMAAGKYSLYRDGSQVRARRDLSGISFASLDAQGRISVQPDLARTSDRSLDELRATVRSAQGGGR